MVHEPREAKSTGYTSPCPRAASCSACSGMPACTVRVRSTGSKSSTWFIRSRLSTSSPLAATAPPDRPVRPPEGTIATRWRLAHCTTACTSATEAGSAMASGAGVHCAVQSRP